MTLPPSAADNLPLLPWPAPRAQHEHWDVLVHHPTRRLAVWLRGSLLATQQGQRECRTWAVVADADAPGDTVVLSQRLSQDAFRVDAGMGVLRFGEGFQLWSNQVTGAVSDAGRSVSFHLSFASAGPTLHAVDGTLARWLTRGTTRLTPNPAFRVTGHVTFGGQRVEFVDAWAHQKHGGGTQMSSSWTWGRAAAFEQDPAGFMEAVSSPRGRGTATSMHVHVGGSRFALNRVGHLAGFMGRQTTSESALGTWKLEGAEQGRILRANVNAIGLSPVMLRQLGPDGLPRFSCLYPWASCAVSVTPSLDGAHASSTFLSKGRSCMEFAAPSPPLGEAAQYLPRAE